MDTKKIERTPNCGEVSVIRLPDERIGLSCGDKGGGGYIVCSEYNARRLLGMLSAMLGLPLQKQAAKQINM